MAKENKDELMPELQDIISRIKAYNSLHPEGCFIFNFLGFKKDSDSTCDDCGGHCDKPDENKSIAGAFGYIDDIRYLTSMIRDISEDEKDKEGFVDL